MKIVRYKNQQDKQHQELFSHHQNRKTNPPDVSTEQSTCQPCLAAWSSGTGFAGIAGYAWSLAFGSADICFQVWILNDLIGDFWI